MNQGVEIHSKAVMTQVFTLVDIIVELGTTIQESKGYIEASPFIILTLNYSKL